MYSESWDNGIFLYFRKGIFQISGIMEVFLHFRKRILRTLAYQNFLMLLEMGISSFIFLLFLGSNFPSSKKWKTTLRKHLIFQEMELLSSKLKKISYILERKISSFSYFFSNISASKKFSYTFPCKEAKL